MYGKNIQIKNQAEIIIVFIENELLLYLFLAYYASLQYFNHQCGHSLVFTEVKLIKNVKNAEFGFAWANTAGDTRSIVLNKEEAVKSLGISLPWPNELDKMTGKGKLGLEKKGINR